MLIGEYDGFGIGAFYKAFGRLVGGWHEAEIALLKEEIAAMRNQSSPSSTGTPVAGVINASDVIPGADENASAEPGNGSG